MASPKQNISKEEKQQCIDALSSVLYELRISAGISMQDLSSFLGISRQSYAPIERKERTMTWQTYIALIGFFDNNPSTHKMLRSSPAFPAFLIGRIKEGQQTVYDRLDVTDEELIDIISELDEEAIERLRTVLAEEYTRCAGRNGKA